MRPENPQELRPAAPQVSIIIPSFNYAAFLSEAIESALAQGGDDVEVIVIDDGSTDNSAAVAEQYGAVRLVRQRNRGLPAARNTGIRESRGEFLLFLDADDRLLPGAVATGLEALAASPSAALTVGNFRWIDERGHVTDWAPPRVVDGDPYEAMLRQSFIPMHATVLFRRAPVEACGGYDESLRACEDFDLYLRILRNGTICQSDVMVAEYRRHRGNLSGNSQLIVESAVAILGREWRHVRHSPRRRQAIEDGVLFWVTAYSNDTLWPAANGAFLRGGWRALRGASFLARHVPVWYANRLRDRAMDSARTMASVILAAVRRFAGEGRAAEVRRRSAVALHWRPFPPPVGHVALGDLRRVTPVDRDFGFFRGWPIDRYYVDQFLAKHADHVRGQVMEVKSAAYTRRFGGDRVVCADVLDIDATNPLATIVGDLTDCRDVPDETFDCVVLTQTLHLVYDVRSAVATMHRILRPGGTALVTVPGISKVDSSIPWHWSFTALSAKRLFDESFGGGGVVVESFGNVLAATAFLQGLATSELTSAELDVHDAEYPVSICIRAVKRANRP